MVVADSNPKDSDAGLIMKRARGSLGTALVLTLIHSPLMAQNDVLAVIPIELERNKTMNMRARTRKGRTLAAQSAT